MTQNATPQHKPSFRQLLRGTKNEFMEDEIHKPLCVRLKITPMELQLCAQRHVARAPGYNTPSPLFLLFIKFYAS